MKIFGVSPPSATGGAGTFLEQHVNAYWLAQLLVRSIPPILHDCTVSEVHFQVNHLGWHTDDVLIIGECGAGTGTTRKLVTQVKKSFVVSASDDDCKTVFKDAWLDFKNTALFSPANDRFALVTLRGTNTLLDHFCSLLDCARASKDGTEFERRVGVPGFLNKQAKHCADEIRTIINGVEGKNVSLSDLCPFLQVFHVLSLDLNTPTSQSESLAKTLLAFTANDADSAGTAKSSWNELLSLVGSGMPTAKSYRHGDLPENLRVKHTAVLTKNQAVLRALQEHSSLIFDGIHANIGGGVHLTRDRVVVELLEKLEGFQVVLVTGTAGSGKSVVARGALEILGADHFVFSFRAEEFACAHFDETLQRIQLAANAVTLGNILAAQQRKVLHVESVERLLEANTRDAFTDLLSLVRRDPSWRVVLTCRHYSADLIRSFFLESSKIGHAVVSIPALSDSEIDQVCASFPSLKLPFANPALRKLMRNPYIVDKALKIPWSERTPLPSNARGFRELFWKDVIRADHNAGGALPHRRQETFVQVALRRARALTMYVSRANLDSEAVEKLCQDSLLSKAPQNEALVAPAHDVLEDWAILNWIEEQYLSGGHSLSALASSIGLHPAVRRTYRIWLNELLERDAATADQIFKAAVNGSALPAHFRDDTLVSLLQSPSSESFLHRHRDELFANGKQLLKRIMHLLRVACMATPSWWEATGFEKSLFYAPVGEAWQCVLAIVASNLQQFNDADCQLLLGLVEDWGKGVTWRTPKPTAAKAAVAIAYWLLGQFDDYSSEDQRKRTLVFIAKVPLADPARFTALLIERHDEVEKGASGADVQAFTKTGRGRIRPDLTQRDFEKIIFEGLDGFPAGRDLPDVVISAAKSYLLMTEEDLKRHGHPHSATEMEPLFGIKEQRHFEFFPASAYRGPFLSLFRNHPMKGIDFTVDVFNHSAEWYANPRIHSRIETPAKTMLTFSDGSTKEQWYNGRMWCLYRGMSVGPYVLQSILMAMERCLLEFAESCPEVLDTLLMRILRGSNSAALTAVVASAATAYPYAAGESLLVLLSSKACIQCDRYRFATESQAPSRMKFFPQLDNGKKVYDDEREAADNFRHRGNDLESAVANLQLGPLAARAQAIIDKHKAAMPPVESQDEDDRLWRLALHRMDWREYERGAEVQVKGEAAEKPVEENTKTYIQFNPKQPDADLREMMQSNTKDYSEFTKRVNLEVWAHFVFEREDKPPYDPQTWAQRLQEARSIDLAPFEDRPERNGPGIVAAICIRDHWDEMTSDDREWCLNMICSEIEREASDWTHIARIQRNSMSADRACARTIPLALHKNASEATMYRVCNAFVYALMHPILEVRWFATRGVAYDLSKVDFDFTMRVVNLIAAEGIAWQNVVDSRHGQRGRRRELAVNDEADTLDSKLSSATLQICVGFDWEVDNNVDAWKKLDLNKWYEVEAFTRIVAILSEAPDRQEAVSAYSITTKAMANWWDEDRKRQYDERRNKNHEAESSFRDLIAEFAMRATLDTATAVLQPILSAVDRHPQEAKWILGKLVVIEDQRANTVQFWSLWRLFAERICNAKWLAGIDDEHSYDDGLIADIFLSTGWKKDARHWKSLENGNVENIHKLFERLSSSAEVLNSYVRFLYCVGEQSLPDSFIRIAKYLKSGHQASLLRKRDTAFMFEVLLQRYVFGRPLELKKHADLADAVLYLLDVLVENGSSAAFRMRDAFVTPLAQ